PCLDGSDHVRSTATRRRIGTTAPRARSATGLAWPLSQGSEGHGRDVARFVVRGRYATFVSGPPEGDRGRGSVGNQSRSRACRAGVRRSHGDRDAGDEGRGRGSHHRQRPRDAGKMWTVSATDRQASFRGTRAGRPIAPGGTAAIAVCVVGDVAVDLPVSAVSLEAHDRTQRPQRTQRKTVLLGGLRGLCVLW